MVERGARNLILLSRSGPRSEAAKKMVHELQAQGAQIATPTCNVADELALSTALKRCAKTMPPIMGCIQASMVLKVCVLEFE